MMASFNFCLGTPDEIVKLINSISSGNALSASLFKVGGEELL